MIKLSAALLSKLNFWLARLPESLVALVCRLAVALVFWRSAQTKIDGWEIFGQNLKFWNLNDSTLFLFEYEYGLPYLPPNIAAYLATFAEFFLALALIAGLLTRLSATGLLIMTAVIQFCVYPESWSIHILWAALLLYLIKHGAGAVSLDYLIHRKYLS